MFVVISLFLVHRALVSWPSNGFLFLDMLCVLYVPIHQVHSNAIMGLPSRQPSPHFICMTAWDFLWFLLSFFVNVPLGLQEHDSVMIHAVMDTQQQKKSSGWYCGNIPWFTKRVGIERHTGGDLGSLGETSGGLKEEMVWCSIVDSFHIKFFLFDLKQAVQKTRAAEIIGCIVDCSSSRCWWYFFSRTKYRGAVSPRCQPENAETPLKGPGCGDRDVFNVGDRDSIRKSDIWWCSTWHPKLRLAKKMRFSGYSRHPSYLYIEYVAPFLKF